MPPRDAAHVDRLGTAPIGKLLISFSVPAIIGTLVSALYNIVDRVFVGQGVGALGIAGITVTTPITTVMIAASVLIGIGANALFAIRLGEGRTDQVEKIMGNAFVLLLAPAFLISGLAALFLDPLLELLGASESVLPYAREYMGILLFGLALQTAGPGFNHFIRSDGNPHISMMTQLIGAILNTILDPLFIFVFRWGIAGAAWATVISQVVSFIWVFHYFNSKKTTLRFRVKNMRLDGYIIRGILAIGFAPFAMQAAASVLMLVLNRTLAAFGGDLAISAMGIILSIQNLLVMPLMGINMGAQPIIGYNYGAKRFDRVLKTFRLSVIGETAFTVAGFAVVQLAPTFLVRLFNSSDVELIELTSFALRATMAALPIVGFQIASSNLFQSIGKPIQGTVLSLARQILLFLPLVLLLPALFGLKGLFFAFPLSDTLSSILAAILVISQVRRLRQLQVEQPELPAN